MRYHLFRKLLSFLMNYVGLLPVYLLASVIPINNSAFQLIIFIIYIILPFVLYFFHKAKDIEEQPIHPVPIAVITCIIQFNFYQQKLLFFSHITIAAAIIYLILLTLHFFIGRLMLMVSYNKNCTKSISDSKIMQNSISLLFIIICTFFALWFLFCYINITSYISSMLYYITKLLAIVLGKLFSFFLPENPKLLEPITIEQNTPFSYGDNYSAGNDGILNFIFNLVLIVIILFMIYKTAIKILLVFRLSSHQDNIIKENINTNIENKIQKKQFNLKYIATPDYNSKVRKYYYKIMIKTGKNNLSTCLPTDLPQFFEDQDAVSTSARLADIYEMTRYGSDLCTAENHKIAKECYKKLLKYLP